MSTERLLGLPLILLVLFTAVSCGFSTRSRISPGMRDVAVVPFENNTGEPGLERRLTDRVVDRILAYGELRLVEPSTADLKVKGAINSYRRIPLVYGENDVVQQYKLRMEISLKLIDTGTGEMLRGFDKIFRETTYSDVNPPRETEYQAQDRLVNQLARDVLTSAVEGWPYINSET